MAVALLAACSPRVGRAPAEPTPAPPAEPPVGATPATPTASTALPCPDEATLTAKLEAALNPAPAKLASVRCTPGHFGRPAWVVTAYLDQFEDGDPPDLPSSSEALRVVLGDDRIIARAAPEPLAPWLRGEFGGIGGMRPVDLDGDGVDEVIEQDGASHGGSSTEVVQVWRLDGDTIQSIFEREIGYDNLTGESDQPIEWSSSVEVAPAPSGSGRQIVVTTTWEQGSPGPEDLAAGVHIFRLVAGAIVEASR